MIMKTALLTLLALVAYAGVAQADRLHPTGYEVPGPASYYLDSNYRVHVYRTNAGAGVRNAKRFFTDLDRLGSGGGGGG
jgi:hypothetical protein